MPPQPIKTGSGQTSREDRVTSGTIMLDRRLFLQLAASGLVVVASGVGHGVARAQSPSPGSPGAPDPVADLATALGNDPERIFRFVQDEVRYEPYAGMLRGAAGTLLARAGNSVDQAVLLASLLQQGGVPVRFVTGALDRIAVDALMASTVTDVETARTWLDQALVSDADVASGITWAASAGPVPPAQIAGLPTLKQLAEGLAADRATYAPVAAAQLQRSLDTITTTLATAGIVVPGQVTGMPALERTGHAWVQWSDGTTWSDLDPSIAGGTATAANTGPLDQLPDELRHRIDFTVTAETYLGGALTQEPILEASTFADELVYRGVLFTHVPAKALGDINLVGGIGAGTLYNAVLVTGPDVHLGTTSVSIGGSSGGDPFGGALSGGDGGIVDGEAAAEWLDVRVTSPGSEPAVARRAIFDRIGQVVRESGVVDPTTILPAELDDLGGDAPDYAPCRTLRAFSVTSGPANLKSLIEDVALRDLGQTSLMSGGLSALRDVHGLELAASLGTRPFDDTPNIVSWVYEPSNDGARALYTMGADIWHRSLGTLGVTGAPPTAPPAMVAGVLAHVIERIGMGEVSADVAGPRTIAPSVGAIFDQAAAAGIPTRLFQGTLPADVPYEPELQLAIQRALDAGRIVIAPEQAVDVGGRQRLGWWLVDPVTGATADERDDGAGGTTEQAVLISNVGVLVSQALQRAYPILEQGAKRFANDPRAMKLFTDLFADVIILEQMIAGG